MALLTNPNQVTILARQCGIEIELDDVPVAFL